MKLEYSRREFAHVFLLWRGSFVCIRATAKEHTRGSWQVCLSVQRVSLSVQNYRPYVVFQLWRKYEHATSPTYFLFMAGYRNFPTSAFIFSVICWSYLRTEISVNLSTGNNYIFAILFYFSLSCEATLLMLSCDRIESAKFIHGTPSPAKPVYYRWNSEEDGIEKRIEEFIMRAGKIKWRDNNTKQRLFSCVHV